MNKTIGIASVTSGLASYPVSYFINEYFSFAIQNRVSIPKMIIDNVTELENKSTAYANKVQCYNVVHVLGNTLENLIASKADKVIILCNICHLYIDDILDSFPTIRPFFINVVEGIVFAAKAANISKILVLCSENARKSQMFDEYFSDANISTFYAVKEQNIIHSIMDAADQNNIDDDITSKLYELCLSYRDYAIYFACTELSMVYGHNKERFTEFRIFDSIDTAVKQLSDSIYYS